VLEIVAAAAYHDVAGVVALRGKDVFEYRKLQKFGGVVLVDQAFIQEFGIKVDVYPYEIIRQGLESMEAVEGKEDQIALLDRLPFPVDDVDALALQDVKDLQKAVVVDGEVALDVHGLVDDDKLALPCETFQIEMMHFVFRTFFFKPVSQVSRQKKIVRPKKN